MSRIGPLTLNQAEFCNNSLNASKVADITITGGRFAQCSVSGSSLNHLLIEGTPADAGANPTAGAGPAPSTAPRCIASKCPGIAPSIPAWFRRRPSRMRNFWITP